MSENKKNTPIWSSKFAIVMAFLGSAIGLANIWRFPKVLYANGGSSFMIPYIVALLTLGLCVYLLEISIGYKFRESLPKIYYLIREKYEWIGWFIIISLFLCCSYYITIIGWDLIYFLLSFTKAWGTNPNFYFSNTLLNSVNSINGITQFVPILIGATVSCWLIIFVVCRNSLHKGIEKMCNILIPALLVIVVIIVISSLFLPGASIGYNQFLHPDWASLTNLNVWLAAFTQISFTLGLGWGILIAYGVYLPEDTNLVSTTFSIPFCNSGFEVFHAIGLFSILGFMTFTTGTSFNSLVTDGSGLTFVVLPHIFNYMGTEANILGPLYFIAIFFAGLTSFGALLEPIIIGVTEKFGFNRKKATAIVVLLCGAISLLFTTRSASWILNVFDCYVSYFCFLAVIIIECIMFGWIYKIDKLTEISKDNFPKNLDKLWKFAIKFIIPIILAILIINAIINHFIPMSFEEHVILIGLIIISLIVPIILTKLPAKNKNYYSK